MSTLNIFTYKNMAKNDTLVQSTKEYNYGKKNFFIFNVKMFCKLKCIYRIQFF